MIVTIRQVHDGLRIFGPLAGPAHIRRPTQNPGPLGVVGPTDEHGYAYASVCRVAKKGLLQNLLETSR